MDKAEATPRSCRPDRFIEVKDGRRTQEEEGEDEKAKLKPLSCAGRFIEAKDEDRIVGGEKEEEKEGLLKLALPARPTPQGRLR